MYLHMTNHILLFQFQEVEDKVHAYIQEKQSNKTAEKDKDEKHADEVNDRNNEL